MSSGMRILNDLRADLRYAVRMMARSRGFTIVAVLSLALGIGANTAIFTMLDVVLWRPLPVQDPERLVRVRTLERATGRSHGVPSPLLAAMQARSDVFTGAMAGIPDGLSFRVGPQAERVIGEVVTANYFDVVGLRPAIGRFFSAQADRAQWEPVAVLSYDFFKRRFGADPAILGQTVSLNGYPFTVIGVSPPGFFGLEVGSSWEIRVPMMLEAGLQKRRMPAMELLEPRNEAFVDVVARLKPGVTRAQAEGATDTAFQQIAAADPQAGAHARYRGLQIRLEDSSRGQSRLQAQFERPLWILMAIVAVVLAIACANVATLLLARATTRQREIAVRLSLGAGRRRLVQQLLTESFVLSCLGGMFGWVLANWITAVLVRFLPQGSIPIVLETGPDARVLAFTCGVAILTTMLFGLVPALQALGVDPGATLKAGSVGVPSSSSRRPLGKLLVVAQVSLALVLLTGAGLFVRSLGNLQALEVGFQSDTLLMFSMKPVQDGNVRNTDAQLRDVLFPELLRRVRALPGVRSASLTVGGPFGGGHRTHIVSADDDKSVSVVLSGDAVSPGFVETMGIPVLRGRSFTDADRFGAPGVVMLGATLARALFGDDDPIGRRVAFSPHPGDRNLRIVGIVPDLRYNDVHAPGPYVLLRPIDQMPPPTIATLVVRSASPDPAGLMPIVRREFQMLDKDLPVFDVRTAPAQRDRQLARERLVTLLATAFGTLAVALAAVGLYGLVTYSVARRVREMGIRLALGADPRQIRWLVLQDTLTLLIAGVVVGLPLAWLSARAVSSELFNVSAHDPVTIGVSVALLATVTLVAGIIPARRASMVDPLIALRAE